MQRVEIVIILVLLFFARDWFLGGKGLKSDAELATEPVNKKLPL